MYVSVFNFVIKLNNLLIIRNYYTKHDKKTRCNDTHFQYTNYCRL